MHLINDGDSVRKMAAQTDEVIKRLKKNLKEILEDLAALNSKWDDKNYKNLVKVMQDRRSDLEALLKELTLFHAWLLKLADFLNDYENAEEI